MSFFKIPAEDFLVVGMKTGIGTGIGRRIGYGTACEYIIIGAGVIVGTGHGTTILLGSQFSSAFTNIETNFYYEACKANY